MSILIKKLLDYGADTQGIMERFIKDEDLYKSCITTFYEDTSFEDLGCAISNKQYDVAFNYAHSLKGVSGNMGLTPLYNLIVILVEALRSKDYSQIDKHYSDVMIEYNKSKDFFCSK